MHIPALGVVMAFVALMFVAWRIWPSRLNPILIGLLSWMPAMTLVTLPIQFVMPNYEHLAALLVSAVCFSIGALVARQLSGQGAWATLGSSNRAVDQSNDRALVFLMLIGLAVFLYAFMRSGLVNQFSATPDDIFESRLALHLGAVSAAVIFLDVTAVVFFAKFLELQKGRYALPMVITMLCYMATLQKSRVVFMGLGVIFLLLLYPRSAKELVFGTMRRRLVSLLALLAVAGSLYAMNLIRGIGVVQYTTFESPVLEQVYIYSGATAIRDLGAAVEGHVPSDPPTFGMVFLRPILWHFVDRDLLNPTKYFEGINAATYLIYPWGDFRWFGFVIVPFLTGAIATALISLAFQRTTLGLMLGVTGFVAVAYSVNTDVVFDPTTLVIVLVSVITHVCVDRHWLPSCLSAVRRCGKVR
jgi:hypothetical protein